MCTVVGQPIGRRIALGDVRRAQQHIPDEQQIAVVAAVVADAVVLHQRMVGEMGCRRRDRALQHPGQRTQRGMPVQPLVPAHRRMRADDHRELDDAVDHIDPAEAQVQQHARQPQTRHQRVVEGVVAVNDAHAHVGGRVVCPVQRPQGRGVAQAVPQVLREVVGQQQHGQHAPPGPVRQCIALGRQQQCAQGAGHGQHRAADEREHQRDRDVETVVLARRLAGKETALREFDQREGGQHPGDGDQLNGLCLHGGRVSVGLTPVWSISSVWRAALNRAARRPACPSARRARPPGASTAAR